MDKKVMLIVGLCIVGIIGFYSFRSCTVNNVVNEDTARDREVNRPAPIINKPEPKLNAILLQRIGDKYICWKKQDFIYVSSDKSDFGFRFEGNKYRLYIVSDNTRVLNFRGDDWERAAYYLGVKLPDCIKGR